MDRADTEGVADGSATSGSPRKVLLLAGLAVAAVVAVVVIVGTWLGAGVDHEAFCDDLPVVQTAVERPEIASPEDFPGEEVTVAQEEVTAALAELRRSAPPSLRGDVATYARGFESPNSALPLESLEAGDRIAEVAEEECERDFDPTPGGGLGN